MAHRPLPGGDGRPGIAGRKAALLDISLITRTIEQELKGTVEFVFAADGWGCEMRLPTGA